MSLFLCQLGLLLELFLQLIVAFSDQMWFAKGRALTHPFFAYFRNILVVCWETTLVSNSEILNLGVLVLGRFTKSFQNLSLSAFTSPSLSGRNEVGRTILWFGLNYLIFVAVYFFDFGGMHLLLIWTVELFAAGPAQLELRFGNQIYRLDLDFSKGIKVEALRDGYYYPFSFLSG